MPIAQPVSANHFWVTMWDVSGPSVFGGDVAGRVGGGLLSATVNQSSLFFGGFSEIEGLHSGLDFEHYSEGGRNDAPRLFTKTGRVESLTFKRGLTYNTDLSDWYAQVRSGAREQIRRDGMIVVTDRNGLNAGAASDMVKVPVALYHFRNALPAKVSGPALNAGANQLAVETLELSHEGLVRLSPALLPGLGDLAGAFGGLIAAAAGMGATGLSTLTRTGRR